MAALLKNFFDIIKRGDIDQVLAERNKLGIDLANLVDEANYKQNCIFYATVIKDENAAIEMAKIFVGMGVKPNQTDTLNQTPLYYAARDGHVKMMEFLINNECNVNHIDTYGQSATFYAAREGHLDALTYLHSVGADIDLVDNNG
jgi:ankyrin repeat protein